MESFAWRFSICRRCSTKILGSQRWQSIAALGEFSPHTRAASSQFRFTMDFVLIMYEDLLPSALGSHQVPQDILRIVEGIYLSIEPPTSVPDTGSPLLLLGYAHDLIYDFFGLSARGFEAPMTTWSRLWRSSSPLF